MIDHDMAKGAGICFGGTDNGIVSMSETVRFGIDRLIFHLDLYNKFLVREDPFSKDAIVCDSPFLTLPETFKIKSSQVQHLTGGKKVSSMLERKKRLLKNRPVVGAEALQSTLHLYNTTNLNTLTNAYDEYLKIRDQSRELYYSNSLVKAKRRHEHQYKQQRDILCASERSFLTEKKGIATMFVGDRGFGVGSSIKGHLKYGGKWKHLIHSAYVPVVVTNEFNTSQTCVFCFQKLDHPYRSIKKNGHVKLEIINGAFQCINTNYLLNITGKAILSWDRLSALAHWPIWSFASTFRGPLSPTFDYDLSHFQC